MTIFSKDSVTSIDYYDIDDYQADIKNIDIYSFKKLKINFNEYYRVKKYISFDSLCSSYSHCTEVGKLRYTGIEKEKSPPYQSFFWLEYSNRK